MLDWPALATDLVAVAVLVFGVYFPRHQRREMLLPYVGLNVGVLAVTVALTNVSVATGLGLGLFGVLSIIRLRSSELTQEEVAYYFAALALGLIGGLHPDPLWLTVLLSGLVVGVVAAVDSGRVHASSRQQRVVLDAVCASEAELVARLEELLGGRVKRLVVAETDLVRDLTVVDVRYRLDGSPPPAPLPRQAASPVLQPADLRPGSPTPTGGHR